MATEILVDRSFFTFPDGREIHKLDEWPEQAKLTSSPFRAKACDLVAIRNGVLWLIEFKDYTYENAFVPKELVRPWV